MVTLDSIRAGQRLIYMPPGGIEGRFCVVLERREDRRVDVVIPSYQDMIMGLSLEYLYKDDHEGMLEATRDVRKCLCDLVDHYRDILKNHEKWLAVFQKNGLKVE